MVPFKKAGMFITHSWFILQPKVSDYLRVTGMRWVLFGHVISSWQSPWLCRIKQLLWLLGVNLFVMEKKKLPKYYLYIYLHESSLVIKFSTYSLQFSFLLVTFQYKSSRARAFPVYLNINWFLIQLCFNFRSCSPLLQTALRLTGNRQCSY